VKRASVPWLLAIVGVSFLARTVVGWLQATPSLMPDEYIYASIGRSLVESGRPLVRGGSAHFPSLLQPIVTAPAWLFGDVGLSYRLVQAIGALAMSLAAVPVYLLARRLGVSRPVGLALAALALLVPDLVYASFVASEPFAYPLVLAAVAAATAALSQPTRRAQLAFVLFAGLAAFTRAQFAVLPVVFLAAVVAQGFRERRTRAALREQLLPLGLFLLPLLALLAAGPAHMLGYYHGVLGLRLHPASFLRWTGWDAMVLAYASGWIIVPGALLGLWLALRRPSSRPELSFALVACLLAVAFVAEAGLLQTNGTAGAAGLNEVKERYLFYLVPLAGICFALYAKRGWPLRLPHLALAAGLVIVSVRVPLSGFAVSSTIDASPILYGVYWLTGQLRGESSASLIVATSVALLSALGVLGSRRPRIGTPVALMLALVATATASAGAVAFDVSATAKAKHVYLAADPSFVDHSGLRDVALLQSFGGRRVPSLQQLFWNRSITRVLLLPGAAPVDAFGDDPVRVGDDGSLLVHGRRLSGPVLVDGFGSTVRLRGARAVARGPMSTLWAPMRLPRLALYVIGRYYDGWLADFGAAYLWPASAGGRLAGEITFKLRAPDTQGRAFVLRFEGPAKHVTSIRLEPGERRTVRIPVCVTGPAYVTFRSNLRGYAQLRAVSVRASAPVFVADESTCPAILTPVQRSTAQPARALA
jgi:hypothetical protein